jgi:hypothetical protein
MQRFVKGYYHDVTNDQKRDQTWAELTPAMQDKSGGRQAYDSFWSGFKSVDVRDTTADTRAGTVTAVVTFKATGGDETDETHVLTLVQDGSSWLIDNDSRSGG